MDYPALAEENDLEWHAARKTSYEETMTANAFDKKIIEDCNIDFSDVKITILGDSITAGNNLSEEDQERAMYQELADAAPLPMRNKNLVVWLMNTKRWTSDSPAKKALRKMKEYGILDSKREGKSSIWFRPSDIQDATEVPLPLEED